MISGGRQATSPSPWPLLVAGRHVSSSRTFGRRLPPTLPADGPNEDRYIIAKNTSATSRHPAYGLCATCLVGHPTGHGVEQTLDRQQYRTFHFPRRQSSPSAIVMAWLKGSPEGTNPARHGHHMTARYLPPASTFNGLRSKSPI